MNLICGINPVIEALAAGSRHFDRLLVVKGLRSRRLGEAIRRASQLGIPLRFEMRETLDRLAGGVPHQGIIAIVSGKPLLSLESLLETVRSPALVVVLDGVEDPRNLGAILRTAEAAGVDGVVLPDRHSAGLSETVARASAGAIEHVRIARVGNLVQALEALKARGLWVVGFDAAGSERWDRVDLKHPVAFVLGGEGRGMRRLVREHCDHLVSIPHFGHVSSLNVSVAAGIALYEAVRQRGAVPSLVRPIPARPQAASQIIGPGPDDGETDPGARLPPVGDPLAEGTADLGEDPTSVPRVDIQLDIHDEVAWGSGPTVLKPVGFGMLRRAGAGASRRRGGGKRRAQRPSVPASPASSPEGAPSHPAAQPDGKARRRRGRRRGHGGGPGAVTLAPPSSGTGDVDLGKAPAGGSREDPAPHHGDRARRRRRRRRQRPPG